MNTKIEASADVVALQGLFANAEGRPVKLPISTIQDLLDTTTGTKTPDEWVAELKTAEDDFGDKKDTETEIKSVSVSAMPRNATAMSMAKRLLDDTEFNKELNIFVDAVITVKRGPAVILWGLQRHFTPEEMMSFPIVNSTNESLTEMFGKQHGMKPDITGTGNDKRVWWDDFIWTFPVAQSLIAHRDAFAAATRKKDPDDSKLTDKEKKLTKAEKEAHHVTLRDKYGAFAKAIKTATKLQRQLTLTNTTKYKQGKVKAEIATYKNSDGVSVPTGNTASILVMDPDTRGYDKTMTVTSFMSVDVEAVAKMDGEAYLNFNPARDTEDKDMMEIKTQKQLVGAIGMIAHILENTADAAKLEATAKTDDAVLMEIAATVKVYDRILSNPDNRARVAKMTAEGKGTLARFLAA